MSLAFTNITTLASQQQARFFQAGFNYSTARTYQIQGYVLDLSNSFGVTGIWTGIDDISRNAQDYQPLLINGINFGSGRIETINFSAGNDVRSKTYNATISVLESGNMFNFTGTYYSGVNLVSPQYLEDFNENWNFEKKNNGGYTYNHNATIKFTSGVGQLNAIQAAQATAQTLFTGSHLGFAFYSGFSDKQGKRFFTESYNLIDNTCSFQDSFDFDSNQGNYSVVRSNSVDLGEDGVIAATERGDIRGIENPNYQKALSALAEVLTGSYYRCSGVASYYFSGQPIMISTPLTQGRSLDIFNNSLSYTVAFNNKPSNLGSYIWDYTQEVTNNNNIGGVTENGTVAGRGTNPTSSFSAAQNGFVTVKAGIPSRTTALFLSTFGSSTNFLIEKNESYSPHQGEMSYGYSYSNDPNLISDTGIRRKEVIVESSLPVYAYNKVNILSFKQILQDDKQSTVGATTVTVNMQGDKSVGLQDFLGAAVVAMNSNAPIGNDRYIGDASYSYNPEEGNLNANLTWVYNRTVTKSISP